MKSIKKLIIANILLGTVFAFTSYSYAMDYSINRIHEQSEINIKGEMSPKELFSVQVLPYGISPNEITNDPEEGSQSVFAKTLEADDEGNFDFNIKFPVSGEYVVYLRSSSDTKASSEKIIFTTPDDKETVVNDVINKLNQNESVDIVNYLKDLFSDDDTLIGYIEKFVNSDKQNDYFSSKMKNKNISDYDDLELKAKKALILTAARDSDGPANLKEVMEEYKDIIGISSLTDKMSVYTAIKGEYANVEGLKAAYENAVKQSSQSSGGNSSSGGSNAGGTYASSGISAVQIESTNTDESAKPIKIKFEDLSSVEWAYKDISELFDKGIVNGVSERLFQPNNPVAREQFVKMTVCAMDLQNEDAEYSGFADLQPNEWYVPYVNIAKKFGVSNGIEDNKFGIGMNISRQDMAVMLYNAMKLRGYTPTGANNTFADFELCADYANEAIAELCSKGIINGMGDNLFEPMGEATRAEAAVIINRALSYLD